MKNICLYARVSTSKEQDVSSQINALRTHASKMGYRIVREYTEEVSGVHGRDKRPALNDLLKDSYTDKFDMVLVWSIDRLGRSLQNLIETIQTIQNNKVDIVFLQQNIDTSDPSGRLMFNLFASLAEYERTMILERCQRGRELAMKNGVQFGRPRVVTDTTRQAVRLMREQGVAIKKIATTMNLGISTVYSALS